MFYIHLLLTYVFLLYFHVRLCTSSSNRQLDTAGHIIFAAFFIAHFVYKNKIVAFSYYYLRLFRVTFSVTGFGDRVQ